MDQLYLILNIEKICTEFFLNLKLPSDFNKKINTALIHPEF